MYGENSLKFHSFSPVSPLHPSCGCPATPVSFDGLGVTMAFLNHFCRTHQDKLEDLTTSQVCDQLIKKQTKTSYLQHLAKDPATAKQYIGKATVFVSHAWGYPFLAAMDCMREYAERKGEEVVFWFDLFCHNQHDAPLRDFDWWSTTFMMNIKSIGKVLLLVMPWDNPTPFTRAW